MAPHGPDAPAEGPGDGFVGGTGRQQAEQVLVAFGEDLLVIAGGRPLVERDSLVPHGLEQLREGVEQGGGMHQVGGFTSVVAVCRDRYQGKARVTQRHLHRQRTGYPGPFALPDAVPDLGHALGLGKGRPFVERPVPNLPLAEQAVFLGVAVGLLGGVRRFVKDPYLVLGVALQPHEGLPHVGRTLDHLDELSGVTGAEAGAAGRGELVGVFAQPP